MKFLLFLLFINDLSFIVSCDLQQYADDTTISASGRNLVTIYKNLTENCNILNDWMGQNKFKLNADKTSVITLGTGRRLTANHSGLDVYMDGVK